MKKKLFIGLAAFLFFAVFSCEVDEQSDGYITLNVPKASGSRALDGPIAEALTNFYEATLQRVSDSKIIRVTWDYSQKGRIYLEPGDYTIILMAGRNDMYKILLGVGKVTDIAGKSSDSSDNGSVNSDNLQVTITSATTDLYFTAYPLMNNIKGDTGSTFETEKTIFPITQFETDGLNKIPVFPITKGATTTATWKFGLGAFPGASGDQISVFGPYIRIARTPDPPSYSRRTIFTGSFSTSFTGPDADEDIEAGTFNMSFTAPDEPGMVQISLNVPVVAIKNSDKPVIWYIRGGLINGDLDAGVKPDNKAGVAGGAILLGF